LPVFIFFQIILDGIEVPDCSDLEFLKTDCPNLVTLSLNNCNVKNLGDFPAGLKIERLELAANNLTGEVLNKLKNLDGLQELHLQSNNIASLDDLKILKEFKNLRILEVDENPMIFGEDKKFGEELSDEDQAKHEAFRKSVFEMIPTLEAVCGFDQEGNPVDFEDFDSEEDEEDDDEDASEDGELDEEALKAIAEGLADEDDSEEDEEDDDEEEEGEEDEEEADEDEEAEKGDKPAKKARQNDTE